MKTPFKDDWKGLAVIAVYIGAFAYGMANLACWVQNQRDKKGKER